MKINKSKIIILNLIAYILFILPISKLDLRSENYSTLSLNTRGYFYLLFIGLFIGLILYYETYYISNSKYSLIIFIGMLIGVIIPHHVPYNLQGNMHLLFAYSGSFTVCVITYLNIYRNNLFRNIYVLGLTLTLLLIMKYSMVTCISEIILMSMIILLNLLMYMKIFRN